MEIPEQDPLFLNTDLVSSRGLCVCEPNINIKAESVLANFAELQVWAADIAIYTFSIFLDVTCFWLMYYGSATFSEIAISPNYILDI